MDERELIQEAKRAYHREYMRDYRKLNPEKVQRYRDNWFLKRALAAKEVKMEKPLESLTPKERALFELEQLKNRQKEIVAKDVMNHQQPTVPTFY
ncbi:hypothetical protein [Brevibacillus halotolerans]|uniref:hypothetical protein n=1 Tax=Brevibacillus halotolerans TaxID=1507437 RepID=UPI0015EEC39E|nr:hypothetical protein [Brevibacillus halotolerans]MBA4532554.1 hypothetical protein [Brevibacillus halotolerans]